MCETTDHADALLAMACDMVCDDEARRHIREARQHLLAGQEVRNVE